MAPAWEEPLSPPASKEIALHWRVRAGVASRRSRATRWSIFIKNEVILKKKFKVKP